MTKTIIAKYKENVEWVKDLPENFEPIIIDKDNDKDLPNLAGREAHTYFHYIYTNYDNLAGDYVFCQGNPFDHSPEFFEEIKQEIDGFKQIGNWHLESSNNGSPHHPGLLIQNYCTMLELPDLKLYPFTAGGQFKVTAERIKKYSKDWYKKALELSETDPQSGYIFERLWQTMYENT